MFSTCPTVETSAPGVAAGVAAGFAALGSSFLVLDLDSADLDDLAVIVCFLSGF